MQRFLLLLIPAFLFAGQTRYARLGEIDGKVDVQLHAADPWSPAERNLPVNEAAWLRTAAASRFEIELDDGSALRLGPDSLIELSDYARLSTGQRVNSSKRTILPSCMPRYTGAGTSDSSLGPRANSKA